MSFVSLIINNSVFETNQFILTSFSFAMLNKGFMLPWSITCSKTKSSPKIESSRAPHSIFSVIFCNLWLAGMSYFLFVR